MKTTFREIESSRPCKDGWKKLCENLNPEMDMSKEVSILEILESNGVEDAFCALRTQNYKDYCLILADVAESVLYVFEEKYPKDERPRKAIEAIRDWHAGKITDEELEAAADDAYTADNTAASGYAADAGIDTYAAAYVTGYAVAQEKQWKKNEAILRKYLGGKNESNTEMD